MVMRNVINTILRDVRAMITNNDGWEHIFTISTGDEFMPAMHPLTFTNLEFNQIKKRLADFEATHKGNYDELRFNRYNRNSSFDGQQESWVLEGKYIDETKRLLYGKRE